METQEWTTSLSGSWLNSAPFCNNDTWHSNNSSRFAKFMISIGDI